MKKTVNLALLFAAALYSSACQRDRCLFFTPTATSNSPVPFGSDIVLDVSSDVASGDYVYEWYGPNGFYATTKSPVIPNATEDMEGTYDVSVSRNGCVINSAEIDIIVNPCPAPNAPSINSNSPINSGSTLNLTAGNVPGATYAWTGPNGFSSNAQNPSIPNATEAMAGTYSLVIMVDGCPSAPVSTDVTFNPPCSLTNNYADYNGMGTINFYAITVDTIVDVYRITANGVGGDLRVTFDGISPPRSGVYNVISNSNPLTSNSVYVSSVTGGTFSYNYVTESGYVYVNNVGGTLTIVFCNLSFFSGDTSITFTGSAKITVP